MGTDSLQLTSVSKGEAWDLCQGLLEGIYSTARLQL